MKRIALMLLFIGSFASAQSNINYNDVIVIVNDNSTSSVNIANYFVQKRNIPTQNVIHISCTTQEQIDSSEFRQIRTQLEAALNAHPQLNDINYLVTTKGLPLKVATGDVSTTTGMSKSASFDSELTMLLSNFDDSISTYYSVINPYYTTNQQTHFSRSQYGIFLVTRLDAYTVDEVFYLIDHSGANTKINQSSSQVILTYANVGSSMEKSIFFNRLKPAHDSLLLDGWNVNLDTSNVLLQHQDKVFGYNIIHHSSITNKPEFTWVNGSIGMITLGYSAMTFDTATAPNQWFTIADLIHEGATGAHGFVYEVYLNSCLEAEPVFTAYTDTANKFNLAESFYKSIPMLSRHDVVIGDPKTSIVIDNTVGIDENSEHIFCTLFPNPSDQRIQINASKKIQKVSIYDVMGNNYTSIRSPNAALQMQLDVSNLSKGMYFLDIQFEDHSVQSKRFIKH
jgi:uncharacterized protein (TIGR03790 family)